MYNHHESAAAEAEYYAAMEAQMAYQEGLNAQAAAEAEYEAELQERDFACSILDSYIEGTGEQYSERDVQLVMYTVSQLNK